MIKSMIAAVPPADRDTPHGRHDQKVTATMLDEPKIEPSALEVITNPTLVLAADHDANLDDHTVAIYQHIQNSQLAIFLNALIPGDAPTSSNATVDRFLRTKSVKKDRSKTWTKSLEEPRAFAQR